MYSQNTERQRKRYQSSKPVIYLKSTLIKNTITVKSTESAIGKLGKEQLYSNDGRHFTVKLLWPTIESGQETTCRQLPSTRSCFSRHRLGKLDAYRQQNGSEFIRDAEKYSSTQKRRSKKSSDLRLLLS